MMTQQLNVSILAAPLEAIDRRALSQAWYSALRFAAHHPAAALAVPSRSPGRTAPPSIQSRATAPPRGSHTQAFSVRALPRKSEANGGGDGRRYLPRRRTDREPLAARIERAFSSYGSPARRATFSLGRGSVRVHVILQTRGGHTALLAICPPQARAVVSRALTQARSALAARGVGIELREVEERRCS
jgi:hypothetical protein